MEGAEGKVEIDSRTLGTGPVTNFASAFSKSQPPRFAHSRPLMVNIDPGRPLPAMKLPADATLIRGLLLKTASGQSVPVQETRSADWLQKAGVKAGEAFGIEGYFDVTAPAANTVARAAANVAAEGVHQFQIRYTGELKLAVDQRLLHHGKEGDYRQIFLPVALAPGQHRLRISAKSASDLKLEIRYGGQGTRSLDGERFRHR
jgi:hypothetical protein